MIDRQKLMVESIVKQLTQERQDNESNKNQLSVATLQAIDLDKQNKVLASEKEYFENKFKNVELLYQKLSFETDSIKFNFTQLMKD